LVTFIGLEPVPDSKFWEKAGAETVFGMNVNVMVYIQNVCKSMTEICTLHRQRAAAGV